ncbi:patatin family protein [Paenibacillus chartarius]|uniref:Patatin family protein n=1 Tax=Paenibacillus chartarius TaxID=747481 RepID=A0ABV6DVI7_9BACL
MSIGLVLEGGGMRGVYTAGALDYLMERQLYYPYVIGVSAGACNAASYISKQIGRNRIVTIDYVRDPRYLSYRNLLREKSIFGMKFIFDEIPNRLVPFDYDTFYHSEQQFVVGTMDALSGEPVYFTKDAAGKEMFDIVQASSSLPFISVPVVRDGRELLDGGICDPIPIRKSIADGNERNVIILTQVKSYRKRPFQWGWLARRVYPNYHGLINVMEQRHKTYNETLDYIDELERTGKAIVIRPSLDLKVGRTEKNPVKLTGLYELGYRDAQRLQQSLDKWAL